MIKIPRQEAFNNRSEPEVVWLLYTLIRLTRAKTIFESGTYTAFATLGMARALKHNGSGKIYTVDIEDYVSDEVKNSKLAKDFIEFIRGNGVKVAENFPVKIDIAFIDSCHEGTYPLEEFKAIEKLLNPNGIVVFHDSISYKSVADAIDYIKRLPNFELITLTTPIFEWRDVKHNLPSGVSIVKQIGSFEK